MAKSDPSDHRTIQVAQDGSAVSCDCAGFDGSICSHIDAVLIAAERAMVFEADRAAADRACAIVSGRITVPSTWKGSWRRETRWRGLIGLRQRRRPDRDSTKPLVCFTGALEHPRAELIKAAKEAGWETINTPSPYTDVLVAADPCGNSAKLRAARANNTPIVSPDQWREIMLDGVLPE